MGQEAEEAIRLINERGPRTVLQSLVAVGGPSTEAEKAVAMFDRQQKQVSDVDFAAHFVGQDTIEGESMTADDRFLLGLLGDTFDEREAVFLGSNPEGEMVEIPTTDMVLFRNNPGEKFRRVNRPFSESIASGDIRETGRDIAGLAGSEGLNIAGEAVSLAVSKRPGGGRVLTDMLRLGVGGAGGEAVQQGVQAAAGTQEETAAEITNRIGSEGLVSVVGGTLGAAAGGAVNLARGRSLFRVTPEGERAVAAAGRLGVDEPLPIQLVDSPFLRLLGRQSQALLPRINRSLRAQQEQLRGVLRGAVDRKARGRLLDTAGRAFDQSNRNIQNLLMTASRSGKKSFRKASQGIQEKVTQWWKTSGDTVDALYRHSRDIEEPSFDLRPALAVAEDVRAGVRAPGIPEDVLDEAGEVIGQEIPSVQVRSFESALSREIDKLRAIDPDLPTVEGFSTPLETLREIRANLRDLTLPGPEGMRQSNALAIKLRSAVEDVIEAASHENPEAIAAYKKAQRAAAKRFATREQAAVVDLLNTETPAKFAASLIQPNSVDNLIALTRAGGREALEEVQDLFVNELGRDPAKITQRLAAFDTPTLNMLLPKDTRAVATEAGKRFDELFSTNIARSRQKQSRVRGFVKDVFDTEDTARIDNTFKLVNKTGGRNGDFGQSVRAAIIDEVWQRAQIVLESSSGVGPGFRKIDAKRLNAVLDDFNERGLLQFLTIGEKKMLRNVELVQRVADVLTPDAGTSLQAASAVAGLRELSGSALRTFAENFGVGKLMTGERLRSLLIGTATGRAQPKPTTAFKLIGAVAANLTTDINSEKELPKDF
jgi:hypothetical protein